jgi:hypothetical protein
MQEMVDIPAAMPAGTDETNSKRHGCHIYLKEERTVFAIERWVN